MREWSGRSPTSNDANVSTWQCTVVNWTCQITAMPRCRWNVFRLTLFAVSLSWTSDLMVCQRPGYNTIIPAFPDKSERPHTQKTYSLKSLESNAFCCSWVVLLVMLVAVDFCCWWCLLRVVFVVVKKQSFSFVQCNAGSQCFSHVSAADYGNERYMSSLRDAAKLQCR